MIGGMRICLGLQRRGAGSFAPTLTSAVRTNPTDGTYRVKTNVLQIWNDTTQLYHAYYCDGAALALRSAFGAGDSASADADADMTTSPTNGTWRVKTKNLQLWNPTTALYHDFYPSGADGAIVTAWGAGDSSSADPDVAIDPDDPDSDFRVINSGTTLQKWNPITGKYHTLYLTGADGAITEAWGAGED